MSSAAQSQGSSFLPDEIVFNILIRLPVRSIYRFKSVCKTWLSIISAPAFVNSHTACSKSHPSPKLLVTIYREKPCSSYIFMADNVPERYLFIADPVPEKDEEGSSLVVVLRPSVTMPTLPIKSSMGGDSDISPGDSQSVGGLMFSLYSKELIGFANPSTNKCFAFSPPNYFPRQENTSRHVSLGFDPVEVKHKFLESLSIVDHSYSVGRTEHRVITLGDGDWRYVKDGPNIARGEQGAQEICINGVIYFTAGVNWASRGIGGIEGWVRCIVAFDVRTESFQAVELSMEGRFNYSPYPWMYVEFEGKLGVVDYPLSNRDSCYDIKDCEHALELWVLEDFQNQVWNLKFAALPPLPLKTECMIRPKHMLVGTTPDGELLFAAFEGGSYYREKFRNVTEKKGVPFSFLFYDMKTGDFRSSEVRFPEGFSLTGNIKITACGDVVALADESESV